MSFIASFRSNDEVLNRAFRIAIGDFLGNIQPWQGKLNASPQPCYIAGLDYVTPWTRDAALNSIYAGNLLIPEIARNTLLSVLIKDGDTIRIGGEYWDAIIWTGAAWEHYLCTRDKNFLTTALEATRNSLAYFEVNELDSKDGLFRGGACFQDGVAGYPDKFGCEPSSGIANWIKTHPDEKIKTGYGLPMKALSTNCLYYRAYTSAAGMAETLDRPGAEEWTEKAETLRDAINLNFWNEKTGTYRYLLDADDRPERQEGFGHAFAILFGIADCEKRIGLRQPIYNGTRYPLCLAEL